ncbi:MAG: glutamine synthetase III [Eubacterium sp.]|nr:glutamine synthetase III [Eubacterium sp.]
MTNIPELFGSSVFNDTVMKDRLPSDAYKELKKTIEIGKALDVELANVVAHAMKDWAVEKGATHFTHWFQPMTGFTAEKHDSFIQPEDGGRIIMHFSGKELVKGEPDASSFPSGGIRATFEARGYTAWDPTSYAFIKDDTLCIPTAFFSYSGEALDKKTPLLRSMQTLNTQAMRILKIFGNDEGVTQVSTTAGCEQEYFLVDKELFNKRPDLIYTGRTLFGAKSPKGQEMDDHYFGAIKPRVKEFMYDLNNELWKLGVLSKTEHNEVAPAQHEMAPIFETTNLATDHNQLTMELMRKTAQKHGLECLLHEKPFAGVNGSGKHNNWSLSTNTGTNLLEPGKTPSQNAQFLLFLVATIKAVDEYQDMIRLSVASAGNDHRLGANEAPPAIVSIFLGEELTAILKAIHEGEDYTDEKRTKINLGVTVLPPLPKDTTDRNRTSPFAFTGNKFELRSLGSAASVAGPNTVLNTAVADVLCGFADELEGADDLNAALTQLIKKTLDDHGRIIFNGNGYDDSWVKEAESRGLTNAKTLVDAAPAYIDKKNVELFKRHKVYNEVELQSRYDIKLEKYWKTLNIEALTMVDMVKKGIIGAVIDFMNELTDVLAKKKTLGFDVDGCMEDSLLKNVSANADIMMKRLETLEGALMGAQDIEDTMEIATYYRDNVITAMNELRCVVDELETLVPSRYWPYPGYGELLYSVVQ